MSWLASAPFLAWAVSSMSQHSGEAQNMTFLHLHPLKKRRRKATPEWAFASSCVTDTMHHASWPRPAVSLHRVKSCMEVSVANPLRHKHHPQTIWKYAAQQFTPRATRVPPQTSLEKRGPTLRHVLEERAARQKKPSSNLLVTQGTDTAVAGDTSEW